MDINSKSPETVVKRKMDILKTYMVLRADIIRDEIIQKNQEFQEENRKNRINAIRQQVVPKNHSHSQAAFEQDGMHPFSVFSVDIWDLLLNKYVSDPRTWLNCFYASDGLRNEEALKWQQNKIIRLLPEVLPNLQKTIARSILTRNDLKSLRLVSKSWRRLVDTHHLTYYSKDTNNWEPGPHICLQDNTINKMFPLYTSPTSKPIVIGSFTVDRSFSDDFSKVTCVLENIGDRIRKFSWFTETKDKYNLPCSVQWYTTLRQWLILMPNLSFLEIKYLVDKELIWSQRPMYEKFSNDLVQQLNVNPLPRFDKLVVLKVKYSVPSQLLNAILSQSPKVKVLRVEIEYPEMVTDKVFGPIWGGFDYLNLNFLTELSIKDYVQHSYFEKREECSLTALKNVNWPLRTLTIDLSTDPERRYGHQNIQHVLKIANQFGKTLEYLRISGVKWTGSTKINKLQLSSPSLRTLELEIEFESHFAYQPFINVDFDFLLELPSLECLSLKFLNYNSNTFNHVYMEESIQIQDYFHRLYESQIWKLIPTLQKLEVNNYCRDVKDVNFSYKHDRTGYQQSCVENMMTE